MYVADALGSSTDATRLRFKLFCDACQCDNLQQVQQMHVTWDLELNKICNPDDNRKALCIAVQFHAKRVIAYLLDHGCDALERGEFGRTLLHESVRWNQPRIEVLETLMKRGVDISATDNFGRTALLECAQYGQSSQFAFLLERGANFDSRR